MTPAEKREQSMIEKYGSIEAVKAKRQEWYLKSRKNAKGGGRFAKDSSYASKMGKKGLDKRWAKNGDDL